MSELRLEPFTNEFGQVINVGDPVVYAGTSWKRTTLRKGKFGGVYYNRRSIYDWKTRTSTLAEESVSAIRINGVPDKRYKYNYDTKKGEYTDIVRTATLPLKRVYRLDTSLETMAGQSI